jgi:membrane protein
MIRDWVEQAHAWSGTATMLGLVMFLIGSARLVALVDAAFEMVFDVERREAPTSFVDRAKAYLGAQARTIAVTMAAGLLMVASLVLRAIGEWVFGGIESAIVEALWIVGREVVSLAMWMAALVLVYWALPPIRLRTADIVQGAFVSAVLVELALIALRIGAGFFDPGAAYGTAGAVVGLLVTLFLVGELFLYGAELTAELSSRGGLSVRSSRDGCPKRIAPTAALGRGLRR